MSRLDDLRAKALAATQGDWHIKRDSEGGISIGHSLNKRILAIVITMNGAKGVPQRDANAAFIAAANPKTVLELLDLLEAKEKELTEANLGLKIANDTVVGLATKLAAERERAEGMRRALENIAAGGVPGPWREAYQELRHRAHKALAETEPQPEHKESIDLRDPDYSRKGIFQTHNCWKCDSGKKPCAHGNPHNCEYPHARND